MDESTKSADVSTAQLTNGSVTESGETAAGVCTEGPTAKMVGALISKCQPPDENNVAAKTMCAAELSNDKNNIDAGSNSVSPTDCGKNNDIANSKTSVVSSSEEEKGAGESVEDGDSLPPPLIGETTQSSGASTTHLQDSLVTKQDPKEPATLENQDNLRLTGDNSGNIDSTPDKPAQKENCSKNDTSPMNIDATLEDTESEKPLAVTDTKSSENVEEQQRKPEASSNGAAKEAEADERSISKMETNAEDNVDIGREDAGGLLDAVKQDELPQKTETTTGTEDDTGKMDKTLSKDAVQNKDSDHEISSFKEKDVQSGVDKDMTLSTQEAEKKPGEIESKLNDSTNKDKSVRELGDDTSGNLSADKSQKITQENVPEPSTKDLLDKPETADDQDKLPAGEENDCCKMDGKPASEDVANGKNCGVDELSESDLLTEPVLNSTEAAVNGVANESKVLEEVQSKEPEIQTKSKPEGTASAKPDNNVNQKQVRKEKTVSGEKLVSYEDWQETMKDNKVADAEDKRRSDEDIGEETTTGADGNTAEKCNGKETSPATAKGTGVCEGDVESCDASRSSQDICVAKSNDDSTIEASGGQDKKLQSEGVGTTTSQGAVGVVPSQSTGGSSEKEKASCSTSGLTDNSKDTVVTTVIVGDKGVPLTLSCKNTQLIREPRAKMTLSPNRMMGKPCSASSPPTATTSFGPSRNKLAAARKTLVNLVSNKPWCSILRQTPPKSDDTSQIHSVIPTGDTNSKVTPTDNKPGAGAARLTLVKGADGKQFLVKTLTEGSVHPTGQVVKQLILVSNPSGIKLGGAPSSKEVETKPSGATTGVMSTPDKENSCVLPPPSVPHKPVQKARKSAHQTNRKAQIAAYEADSINNRTHSLNPFANMTIKVPDLENALGIKQKSLNKLDAKTLDKILLDNVQRAIKKHEPALHEAPIPVSSVTNVSTILVGQSILRRKKRRRMGMYKLPDLKKKANKKPKKCGFITMQEQSACDMVADDTDPPKSDIQKLFGQLKTKRKKRQKLWACGKVYKAPTKAKTARTGDNTATPRLLQAKLEKLDEDMTMSDGRKWSNNLPSSDTPEQHTPEDNLDGSGNRRSQRKRKGTIDEETWSVTSPAGDSDVSSTSTSRGDQNFPASQAQLPIAAALTTHCSPTVTRPQKTIGAATWSGGGVSSRVTQSDKMVYTHPLGSLPVQLQQKLKAMSPQQADLPAPPGGSLLKFVSTPNGMTFPLSPAKPDDTSKYPMGRKAGHMSGRHAPGEEAERDFIPLCCCKITGASFANLKQVIYCQALDSIDGKVVGCCNKVTNGQLVRSAVKIPFMAVCEQHRKRLRLHQCCPGCGHFCTQGKFYQCKKEGSAGVHHFHKQCQVFRDNKYYCPHCGTESHQVEVNLKLHDPTKLSLQPRPQRLSTVGPRARMGVLSPKSSPSLGAEDLGVSISVRTTSTNKEISTAGMPLGPSRTELENIITLISNDKPKKLRASSKSLYAASYAGEVEKVLAILLDGMDPNMQFDEFNRQTALHAAAIGGYLSVVHLLIQAGASPHINDQNLCTAAICAAEYGQTAVVRYLIKAGAIANAKGQDGMTCLHLAAKCGSVDTVKYLVQMTDTDINIKDDGGWTPLVWATESCHLAVVRYMLLVGADPNIRDNEENTGLHWAAYAGCVDVAELFLNAGCCLEAANEHGDRPLHIAARQDHYECIVLFLARGADSEARNNNNKSAISCCVDQNGQVWMALRVNKQLKGFATQRLHQPEQLLHRDISMGREANPLPVVNGVDEENYPTDFQYLMNNAETSPMNINHVITSLQCCQCRDNCCSTFCICSRNSVKCWYDKEGRLLKDFNYMDPPLIFECNKACSCWANCRNRVIQLGIVCRLQVFRTAGRGWGVRTLLNIPQGTFVCEYIGELISDTVADNREDDSYLFDLDNKESDTYCIDARRYGNVSRFINHLCEPNLLPVKVFVEHQDLRFPRMCFFATRDIKANEELGFDYGEKFWIIKWKHFTCTCGSAKCKYSATTIHQTISDYNQRMAEDNAVLN